MVDLLRLYGSYNSNFFGFLFLNKSILHPYFFCWDVNAHSYYLLIIELSEALYCNIFLFLTHYKNALLPQSMEKYSEVKHHEMHKFVEKYEEGNKPLQKS